MGAVVRARSGGTHRLRLEECPDPAPGAEAIEHLAAGHARCTAAPTR